MSEFCKKCKIETERNARGGCKPCRRAVAVKYYAANKKKIHAARVKHASANPEKIRAVKAKYRAANTDKANAATAAWVAVNPDKCRIYSNNRRVRKLASGGKLTQGIDAKLFKLQKGKCPCCNQPLGDNYHLDHIMPLALGGTNEDSNIQLLRSQCNLQKHARHPIDFMQSRGFLL